MCRPKLLAHSKKNSHAVRVCYKYDWAQNSSMCARIQRIPRADGASCYIPDTTNLIGSFSKAKRRGGGKQPTLPSVPHKDIFYHVAYFSLNTFLVPSYEWEEEGRTVCPQWVLFSQLWYTCVMKCARWHTFLPVLLPTWIQNALLYIQFPGYLSGQHFQHSFFASPLHIKSSRVVLHYQEVHFIITGFLLGLWLEQLWCSSQHPKGQNADGNHQISQAYIP